MARQNQYKNYCEIVPSVGSYVYYEEWQHGSTLIDCTWDKAKFRLNDNLCQPAVNIDVTGRTIRYPFGSFCGPYVRVKITFVADKCIDWYTGEMVGQDVVVRGWMKVDDTNRTYKGE